MRPMRQGFFAIVIAFAVICFWRGVWGLLDEYLFPYDYTLSLLISMIIGLVILGATHYTVRELT
ncbi:MAG: hypothetical protein JXB14_01805 [Candidatus Altiarchaeota archaeon]|nr:hypothetical protein [Candidatus Altiarchaeota archaeon]